MRLLQRCFLAFVFLTPSIVPIRPADAAGPIDQYRWKKRVIVLLAPNASDESFKKQEQAYAQARAEYDDRDLTVLSETVGNGPLHRKFRVPAGEFRFLLIGKDGHTALERSAPVPNEDLFGLIDSMPMRKEEKARKGS